MSAFLPEILWSMQPEATEAASKSEGAASGSGAQGDWLSGPGMQTITMLVLMFLVFYFVLVRPQQKRQKEVDTMLKALRKGDKVRTSSGIRGEIVEMRENDVDLLIADKVKINVLRSHVAGLDEKRTTEENKGKS